MINHNKVKPLKKVSQISILEYIKTKAFVLLLVINFISFSANAIPIETKVSITDENRVLNEAIELHLSSTTTPLINSTVSLNHKDAWLFFDNIRPSQFLSEFSQYVYINGEKLSNNVNGRVAIYAHGTVIMPHGSAFKPLTAYTSEDYKGNYREFEIHTYYNKLDDFDNSIKSFKLKRGYMATLATNADGSGYSRVFIADNEDLEFAIMPAELIGAVSFIRVFKHQWVTKKGWCGWGASEIEMANVTCYYDWNVGGNTSDDFEYTPIRQNGGWPSWTDINAKTNVSHLLGFNEPDRPDQSNMTFDQMIDIWPGMMNSGLRIGSPAWSNPWGGNGGNLFDFITKCEELNYRVDFVALHCYWGGKSPQSWYNDLKYIHETTGRPLWITEWNNGANWTTEWWPDATPDLTTKNAEKQLNDIIGILNVLDTAHFVERYFIYNWVEDRRAMILNGALTPAGEYYANNKSRIAYNKVNDINPEWSYTNPTLSFKYLNLANAIRLEWINPNNDLCKTYTIERQTNNTSFNSIYTSDDMSKTFYLDTINQTISGTIKYRISLLTSSNEILSSNIVAFHQTSGSNSTQFGNFSIDNLDWSFSLFSEKYSTEPMVILGIPTFNNSFPLTTRINETSTTIFNFQLDTWDYLKNPIMSKTENISALTIPAGIHDFGGLKSEASSLNEVARDWVSVSFTDEFTNTPVVFASIVSNKTAYPLTTAIKNVTTTGFEISLKTEEKVSAVILPETINFIAIEPGTGLIEGKRITIGRTEEGAGISTEPIIVPINSSYVEPVIFGSLLTANNTFASTLRYYYDADNSLNIIKQRELSGTISANSKDDLGWMVLDLSLNQDTITGINNKSITNTIHIYPNPVTDIIYFSSDKPIFIEIYDVIGQKKMATKVINQLDISTLHAGVYLLKIDESNTIKFIKK